MAAAKTALVTGSSGLIGSEAVAFLDARGWRVHGVDNNLRRLFFGAEGDTSWNLERLQAETRRFVHHDLDVRDRAGIARLVAEERPRLIVHCAAQPSHDLAARLPFDDFDAFHLEREQRPETRRRADGPVLAGRHPRRRRASTERRRGGCLMPVLKGRGSRAFPGGDLHERGG